MLARIQCLAGSHDPSPRLAFKHAGRWLTRCDRCQRAMHYTPAGEWELLIPRPAIIRRLAPRTLMVIGAALLSTFPTLSAQAARDFSAPSAESSEKPDALAARWVADHYRTGMHCRSILGSVSSAVEQVRARSPRPGSFVHFETTLGPNVNGRHAFAMTYALQGPSGLGELGEVFGTVDHATCEAHL